LQRNMDILRTNLRAVEAFMREFEHVFRYRPPAAGSVVFPRYRTVFDRTTSYGVACREEQRRVHSGFCSRMHPYGIIRRRETGWEARVQHAGNAACVRMRLHKERF
jgi:hypothetical protein